MSDLGRCNWGLLNAPLQECSRLRSSCPDGFCWKERSQTTPPAIQMARRAVWDYSYREKYSPSLGLTGPGVGLAHWADMPVKTGPAKVALGCSRASPNGPSDCSQYVRN